MPYLGDYIGQLLAEVTIARMQADLETVRVAELYASHPILRVMPVPRFRLPNIEMDIPVVIKKMEEPQPDTLPRGAPTLKILKKTFDKILDQKFKKELILITPDQMKELKKALDNKLEAIGQPDEVAVDVYRVADDLTKTTLSVLKTIYRRSDPLSPEQLKKFEAKLKTQARTEFLKLRQRPPRIQVLVETAEVREAARTGDVISRFHLKISEEAFEWKMIESDGQMEDRLVPE